MVLVEIESSCAVLEASSEALFLVLCSLAAKKRFYFLYYGFNFIYLQFFVICPMIIITEFESYI